MRDHYDSPDPLFIDITHKYPSDPWVVDEELDTFNAHAKVADLEKYIFL
jgi:hypothetical protein